MLFLGFSAGLPLLLILGTLIFWLREAGIDRSTIGYLTWIGLIYAGKWLWAPLVDRLQIPVLTKLFGRRRSWLLFAQALIVIGLVGMSSVDPKLELNMVQGYVSKSDFHIAVDRMESHMVRIEDKLDLLANKKCN